MTDSFSLYRKEYLEDLEIFQKDKGYYEQHWLYRMLWEITDSPILYSKEEAIGLEEFKRRLYETVLYAKRILMPDFVAGARSRIDTDPDIPYREFVDQALFRPPDLDWVYRSGESQEMVPRLSLESIEEGVGNYLARPWMQHVILDWHLVRNLAYCTALDAQTRFKKAFSTFGWRGNESTFHSNKGEMGKLELSVSLANLREYAIRITLFAVPVWVVGAVFWNESGKFDGFVAAMLIALLLSPVLKYKNKLKEGHIARLAENADETAKIYRRLHSRFQDPRLLRKLFEKGEPERGWPAGIFAILEAAVAGGRIYWDRDTYPSQPFYNAQFNRFDVS